MRVWVLVLSVFSAIGVFAQTGLDSSGLDPASYFFLDARKVLLKVLEREFSQAQPTFGFDGTKLAHMHLNSMQFAFDVRSMEPFDTSTTSHAWIQISATGQVAVKTRLMQSRLAVINTAVAADNLAHELGHKLGYDENQAIEFAIRLSYLMITSVDADLVQFVPGIYLNRQRTSEDSVDACPMLLDRDLLKGLITLTIVGDKRKLCQKVRGQTLLLPKNGSGVFMADQMIQNGETIDYFSSDAGLLYLFPIFGQIGLLIDVSNPEVTDYFKQLQIQILPVDGQVILESYGHFESRKKPTDETAQDQRNREKKQREFSSKRFRQTLERVSDKEMKEILEKAWKKSLPKDGQQGAGRG